MNSGKYVFSQIVSFLPARIFDRCVNSFQGDKWVKHFTCWNQMMCMMFGQLSNRDSLRDLLVCLTAHKTKHYHLGFGKSISRSNLAEANEKRDAQIFEMYAYELIAEARKVCITNVDLDESIQGNVYAFDSSTIDLCLNVFWWATFRRSKAAVKLHTLLDVRTSIPVFVHITPASVHDVNGLDFITYEPGGYYIMDRGYIDFDRMATIDKHDSYFVIRSRKNLSFIRISAEKADKKNGVMCDQRIKLKGFNSIEKYEKIFRRVKFYDAEQNRTFIFLSNNLTLKATEIAMLYKNRWKIELFFKWIKQHLKIKSFWGVSENAVRTQIYIAIITYTLVVIIKAKLKLKQSPYEILQIMSVSLLDKTHLSSLFENPLYQDVKEQNHIQLKINLI
jgi:IS4 transposase